jgi:hypothetical protein
VARRLKDPGGVLDADHLVPRGVHDQERPVQVGQEVLRVEAAQIIQKSLSQGEGAAGDLMVFPRAAMVSAAGPMSAPRGRAAGPRWPPPLCTNPSRWRP